MATVNRLYFDTPDYTASYDYDDQALKLVAVHVANRQSTNLTIELHNAADDALLNTFVIPPQTSVDRALNAQQQATVVLDSRGRVTNVYAKTA